MVSGSRVPHDWWILWRQNGCLGLRLRTLLNGHQVPTFQRLKLTRSNPQNQQSPWPPISRAPQQVQNQSYTHETQWLEFPTKKRYRTRKTHVQRQCSQITHFPSLQITRIRLIKAHHRRISLTTWVLRRICWSHYKQVPLNNFWPSSFIFREQVIKERRYPGKVQDKRK